MRAFAIFSLRHAHSITQECLLKQFRLKAKVFNR